MLTPLAWVIGLFMKKTDKETTIPTLFLCLNFSQERKSTHYKNEKAWDTNKESNSLNIKNKN